MSTIFGVNPDEAHEESGQPIFGETQETPEEVIEQAGPDEGQPGVGLDTEQGQSQHEETQHEETQGEEDDWTFGGQFKDEQALAKSYREARKKLSQRDEERESLRGQVQQYQTQLQQMGQYLQYMQQMQMAQQQQAQQVQQPQQASVDPHEWFEKLSQGPQPIEELLDRKLSERDKQLQQGLQQNLAPLYQHYQQQQMQNHYVNQFNQLKAKYPDVDNYRAEMSQLYNERPDLAQLPDGGFEVAYQIAKARQVQNIATQAQNTAQKKAHRIPPSTSGRPGTKQETPEDLIKKSIFGVGGGASGIFG